MRALPYFMFIAAVGAMLTYHSSMAPQVRWMAATLTPFFLGVSAIGAVLIAVVVWRLAMA